MKSSLSLVTLLSLLALPAQAAILTRSASIFKEPDQGSQQVLTLKKGQHAKTTQEESQHDDRAWIPVRVGKKSGWIEADALTLTEGDAGFIAPEPEPEIRATHVEHAEITKLPRIRFWGGLGVSEVMTDDVIAYSTRYNGRSYTGAAFAGGFDVLLGRERSWPLGTRILFPYIKESSQGFGAGRITRVTTAFSFGHALIPQKLELSGHLGFTSVRGESRDFDSKLGFTPGLTLAWQISPFERGSLYQAIELGVFHTEETRGTAADIGFYSGLCDGLSTVFGGSSDPSCTRGVAPAAFVFTLLYKLGGVH